MKRPIQATAGREENRYGIPYKSMASLATLKILARGNRYRNPELKTAGRNKMKV